MKKVYLLQDKDGDYCIRSYKYEEDEVLETFEVPKGMFTYLINSKYLSGIRDALIRGIRQAKTGYERIPIRERILKVVIRRMKENDKKTS